MNELLLFPDPYSILVILINHILFFMYPTFIGLLFHCYTFGGLFPVMSLNLIEVFFVPVGHICSTP